jgi:enoyl-[acyl-carrier protein] reductase I
MSKLLEGKLALILGIANKWSLAYAIAQAFSREGAALVLTYLGERQKESIADLSKDWNVAAILPCDVTKDDDLTALTESLRRLNRPLHAVVHSLAFANREDLARPFVETSRAGFLLAQDVSAYSLVAVARATAGLMTEGGSLSTLTYIGSTRVMPNYNVMGVAKAALEASVRYLAADFGSRGIRVNAISAGPVRTLAGSGIGDARAMFAFQQKHSPLGRGVTLDELGGSALYLLSRLSGGVTGETHFVDSGYNVISMPRPENLKDAAE